MVTVNGRVVIRCQATFGYENKGPYKLSAEIVNGASDVKRPVCPQRSPYSSLSEVSKAEDEKLRTFAVP